MASNWRFNVWDLGYNLTPFRLIAYSPGIPLRHGLALYVLPGGERFILASLSLDLRWPGSWYIILGETDVPFPAGYPVSPD